MAVADRDRRRLSVGTHAAAAPVARLPRPRGSVLNSDIIRLKGIENIFDLLGGDVTAGKRSIALRSLTDQGRKEFSDKSVKRMLPAGAEGNQAELERWLKTTTGWACKKGLKPEAPNQDSFSVLVVQGEFALYGVYDGHGPNGHDVSELVCDILPKLYVGHEKKISDPQTAFRECFQEMQYLIESNPKLVSASTSGSTCTMAFHNMKTNVIHVAHVGDSRCVYKRSGPGKKVEEVTVDHKPNLEKEKARIESANPPGRVIFDGYYNHRVFAQNGMYPGLNMSRAFGDVVAHKEAGLTAEPDYAALPDVASGDVLLLCSDGVWEFIENVDAFEEIKKAAAPVTPETQMAALAKSAYDKWMKDSEGEISDDITGILMYVS